MEFCFAKFFCQKKFHLLIVRFFLLNLDCVIFCIIKLCLCCELLTIASKMLCNRYKNIPSLKCRCYRLFTFIPNLFSSETTKLMYIIKSTQYISIYFLSCSLECNFQALRISLWLSQAIYIYTYIIFRLSSASRIFPNTSINSVTFLHIQMI